MGLCSKKTLKCAVLNTTSSLFKFIFHMHSFMTAGDVSGFLQQTHRKNV